MFGLGEKYKLFRGSKPAEPMWKSETPVESQASDEPAEKDAPAEGIVPEVKDKWQMTITRGNSTRVYTNTDPSEFHAFVRNLMTRKKQTPVQNPNRFLKITHSRGYDIFNIDTIIDVQVERIDMKAMAARHLLR